ncbi:MAG: hypothetical protein EBE86_035525 [Hormoscilla sp. GUM202]|nr:hypothetical protein [Hormoscilla sp. GUM202]
MMTSTVKSRTWESGDILVTRSLAEPGNEVKSRRDEGDRRVKLGKG